MVKNNFNLNKKKKFQKKNQIDKREIDIIGEPNKYFFVKKNRFYVRQMGDSDCDIMVVPFTIKFNIAFYLVEYLINNFNTDLSDLIQPILDLFFCVKDMLSLKDRTICLLSKVMRNFERVKVTESTLNNIIEIKKQDTLETCFGMNIPIETQNFYEFLVRLDILKKHGERKIEEVRVKEEKISDVNEDSNSQFLFQLDSKVEQIIPLEEKEKPIPSENSTPTVPKIEETNNANPPNISLEPNFPLNFTLRSNENPSNTDSPPSTVFSPFSNNNNNESNTQSNTTSFPIFGTEEHNNSESSFPIIENTNNSPSPLHSSQNRNSRRGRRAGRKPKFSLLTEIPNFSEQKTIATPSNEKAYIFPTELLGFKSAVCFLEYMNNNKMCDLIDPNTLTEGNKLYVLRNVPTVPSDKKEEFLQNFLSSLNKKFKYELKEDDIYLPEEKESTLNFCFIQSSEIHESEFLKGINTHTFFKDCQLYCQSHSIKQASFVERSHLEPYILTKYIKNIENDQFSFLSVSPILASLILELFLTLLAQKNLKASDVLNNLEEYKIEKEKANNFFNIFENGFKKMPEMTSLTKRELLSLFSIKNQDQIVEEKEEKIEQNEEQTNFCFFPKFFEDFCKNFFLSPFGFIKVLDQYGYDYSLQKNNYFLSKTYEKINLIDQLIVNYIESNTINESNISIITKESVFPNHEKSM